MSDLQSTNVTEIVEACKAGLGEVVDALCRSLDATFRAEVGEPEKLRINTAPFAGPGLMILLGVGPSAALVTIPESSALLPEWIEAPDATGASKLTTLAQELGMLLLPGTLEVDNFRAARVVDLAAALTAALPTADAQQIVINVSTADDRKGPMTLCTPFTAGAQAFAAAAPAAKKAPAEPKEKEKPAGVLRGAEAAAAVESAQRQRNPHSHHGQGFDSLPPYSRSLLKVRVPVMVTLARKKQRVSQIVELGPGSIIQFSKSCEQLLELEVNGRTVGEGEAVKVGEKFGLRVTGMVLPGEKFKSVQSKRKP